MTQAHQIAPGHVNDKIIFPFWSGGRKSHNSDTPLIVGAFSVDPTDYALSTLNYTSTVMEKKEASLTIGAAAGNLKNSEKLYEVRIWVDSPTTPEIDTIELYSAHLILQNQVQ